MHPLRERLNALIQPNQSLIDRFFSALDEDYWLINLENPSDTWFSGPILASLGYTPDSIKPENGSLNFINSDDFENLLKEAKSPQRKSARTHPCKIRCKHKNGEIIYWICTGFVIENEENRPGILVVRSVDVTEETQKKVQANHFSQSLKKMLFDLGDLVLVVDRDFIVTDYHQNRIDALLFALPSEFVNKHIKEIGLSEDDLRNFIISIYEAKEEGRIPEVEFKLTFLGKTEFYSAKVASLKDDQGQLMETIFIASNITEKRQAEVRLQELALVGAKTTDLTIITDAFCNITWVNKAFEDHTGYALEEIAGRHPAMFLHGPETDPVKKAKVDQAIREKKPIRDTMVNYTKDGRKYWVDFRIDPVFNEVGMCSHFISIERDITLRKKAEEELEHTRSYLLETNRVGKVGGWSYDVVRDKVYWTDVTREIHELPEDFEPTVEKVIQFYKEGESRQKYFEVGMNAIQNGVPYDVELQIVTAKGREVWVRAIGKVEFVDGVCTRLYGTFQDIDSFKRVEKELKESSALLKYLTDHVPGCLYQYELLNDGRNRLPYVSEGLLDITGYSPEEVKINPNLIFTNIHPEDLPRVQAEILSSSETLEQWTCDYRILTKSGEFKWIRGISRPQPFPEGVQWFGFFQEIEADQVKC
jgi:PAS domain S-box-containing protein